MDAKQAEIAEAMIVDAGQEYVRPYNRRWLRRKLLVLWDKESNWWSLFPEPEGVTCDQCERRSFIIAACFPIARLCLLCWRERQ